MPDPTIAETPPPPYVAVIFTSLRTDGDNGYAAMTAAMTAAAREQPGYLGIEAAREDGSFKSGIPSEFAAMCFYGAIEQLLTGWIFEVLPRGDEEFEHAKDLVVEAICGGLENGVPGRQAASAE